MTQVYSDTGRDLDREPAVNLETLHHIAGGKLASLVPRIPLPSLRLFASERKLLLAAGDLLIMSAALVATTVPQFTRRGGIELPTLLAANVKWFVTLAVVWLPLALLLESYDLARAASAPHSILSAGSAAGLTVLIYHFMPFFTPPLTSRGSVFLFALTAMGGIALWRGLYALLFVQPSFQQRALVLGAGFAGRTLAETLAQLSMPGNPFQGTGYLLVGFLDDDPNKRGYVAGIPILGGSEQLPALAKQLGVDEVVLAITHRHTMSQAAFDALLACREQGIPVTTVPALYERLLGRVPVEHVGRDLHAVVPMQQGATQRLFWIFKRLLDLALGTVGLVGLAVATPFVALANAVWAPGPLFFRQERVGRGGRIFTVIKFRTMVPDAERETGAVWATENDPRATPVGRWLRRIRLDELPQVINVLRGEMSLIGPRPERPEFVEQLAQKIPFYRARHAVRPGISGWAQVCYHYGNSVDDARVKLEYDLYYVKRAGFYLDALIFLKTLAVILRFQGQ